VSATTAHSLNPRLRELAAHPVPRSLKIGAGCGAGWSGFAVVEVGAELVGELASFFVGGDIQGAGCVF